MLWEGEWWEKLREKLGENGNKYDDISLHIYNKFSKIKNILNIISRYCFKLSKVSLEL